MLCFGPARSRIPLVRGKPISLRLEVHEMTRPLSSLSPAERAAFLAEKREQFLKALARELDWLDPQRKASARCFQKPKRGRPRKWEAGHFTEAKGG